MSMLINTNSSIHVVECLRVGFEFRTSTNILLEKIVLSTKPNASWYWIQTLDGSWFCLLSIFFLNKNK